jgi:hypothetical protein
MRITAGDEHRSRGRRTRGLLQAQHSAQLVVRYAPLSKVEATAGHASSSADRPDSRYDDASLPGMIGRATEHQ